MKSSKGLSAVAPPNIVTGAFGFTGKYIARLLLQHGEAVRTLTAHPDRNSALAGNLEIAPLDFSRPDELAESMRGATTLFNTYWVRFDRGDVTHDVAVRNTAVLVRAAEDAGVKRIVHISVSNPSLDSPLPYFRGKAQAEQAVLRSKMSHAIVRPALLFGPEDILINNIAWLLRSVPVFAIPGDGMYRVQPIFVEDLAQLAVDARAQETSFAIDAVGPEIYRYSDLVQLIADTIGSTSRIVHMPPGLMSLASRIVGHFVNDVVLTKDEIAALMADLLVSNRPAMATTSLRAWLSANAGRVGVTYASELARHYVVATKAS
jgi:uncharacterized protein YbjT (DUF2867 family)